MMDIAMLGPASLAVMNNDYWEGDLSHLPSERLSDETPAAHPDDELSARRAARLA